MTRPRLVLKPGREKSLLRRHPWVFSGAVERIEGDVEPGAEVLVADAKGDVLAVAGYSPASQMKGRSREPYSSSQSYISSAVSSGAP